MHPLRCAGRAASAAAMRTRRARSDETPCSREGPSIARARAYCNVTYRSSRATSFWLMYLPISFRNCSIALVRPILFELVGHARAHARDQQDLVAACGVEIDRQEQKAHGHLGQLLFAQRLYSIAHSRRASSCRAASPKDPADDGRVEMRERQQFLFGGDVRIEDAVGRRTLRASVCATLTVNTANNGFEQCTINHRHDSSPGRGHFGSVHDAEGRMSIRVGQSQQAQVNEASPVPGLAAPRLSNGRPEHIFSPARSGANSRSNSMLPRRCNHRPRSPDNDERQHQGLETRATRQAAPRAISHAHTPRPAASNTTGIC